MAKVNLKVEGMTCGGCAAKVKKALTDLGATAVDDLQSKVVEVEYDDTRVTVEELKSAVKAKGYDVI